MAVRRRRRGWVTAVLLLFSSVLVGYAVLSLWPSDVAEAPAETAMRLDVPGMSRAQDVPVYGAAGDDTAALDAGAIHLDGTGFPWESGSNVYIAGHRLGYAGTGSFLIFYDLDKLENGDEVVLTDAGGTEYTYSVFRKFVIEPTETGVTQPVAGKNVVTLQTCTLPDYSQRLVVQAELTTVA